MIAFCVFLPLVSTLARDVFRNLYNDIAVA